MSTERLEFGIEGMTYHAMTAAEHISRYFQIRSLCAGKRVLDIACGEGYGSRLLSKWGAKEVVGIDISPDAIQKARAHFAADSVRFLVADACNLDPTFLAGPKFDVICSFETIEHVDEVDSFLRNIASLRSDSSNVVISCPNDEILPDGTSNPFHRRVLNLGEFKSTTENVLGAASAWFLGVPLQGYTILPHAVAEIDPGNPSMDAAMNGRDGGDLWLLPPQQNIAVRADNADFFVGLWGGPGDFAQASVASSLSQSGFTELWESNEWLRKNLNSSKVELEAAKAEFLASKIGWEEANDALKDALKEATDALKDASDALETTQRELQLRTSDLRRSEIVLAEERRAAFTYRARADSLFDKLHVVVTREDMKEIAKEVWWERNRRGLLYKIAKAVKRRFGRDGGKA